MHINTLVIVTLAETKSKDRWQINLQAVLGQLLLQLVTYYLQQNYLVIVTYYPKNKVTIIMLHNYYITLCPQF